LRGALIAILACLTILGSTALGPITVADVAVGAFPLLLAFLWRRTPEMFHWSARFHVPAVIVFWNVTMMVARGYELHWSACLFLAAYAYLGWLLGDAIEARRSTTS
jgi:hypothetical protein